MFWKIILNNSNGVIAISNKINRWLVKERGINPNLISTIHYGVKIKDRPPRINITTPLVWQQESFHGKDGTKL